jgi:CSLREA domain-containing protein
MVGPSGDRSGGRARKSHQEAYIRIPRPSWVALRGREPGGLLRQCTGLIRPEAVERAYSPIAEIPRVEVSGLGDDMRRGLRYLSLVLTLTLLAARGSNANDFVVATTQDADLANPADTSCVSTLGNCTLRAAIHAAENVGPGPHRIALAAPGTSILTLGALEIDGITVLIENTSVLPGPPPKSAAVVIDGGKGPVEVFTVGLRAPATVFLYGRSSGPLTIQNGHYGAIALCAAPTGPSTMTLTNVNVSGNSGFDAIDTNYGTMTLNNVTVSGNSFSAIRNNLGYMTLTNVTVSGNSGLFSGGIDCTLCTMSLINVTISGNMASSGSGAGINNGGGAMTLTNVTISGNSASTAGGIYNGGVMTLTNSIVANNPGGDCSNTGTLNPSGINIVKDGSCTGPGVLAVDPLVGTLGSNGGFVQTIPLLAGSPAITALPYNLPCPPTDARGLARPHPFRLGGFAYCDLGAFEK